MIDIAPDILLLGKCLGGGVPVGVILASDAVASTVHRGDRGGTYSGNALACTAIATVIAALTDQPILDHCRRVGGFAIERLRALHRRAGDRIVDVRARGLLIGCELASEALASTLMQRCLEEGVIGPAVVSDGDGRVSHGPLPRPGVANRGALLEGDASN